MPCQSSCWGRRYTPVVCYERRRPYTSHSPRPVATKNKIDATLSLRFLRTQAAFYRARNDISLPSYEEPCTSWPPVEKCIHCLFYVLQPRWRWFPGCIKSLDSGDWVQEYPQPWHYTPCSTISQGIMATPFARLPSVQHSSRSSSIEGKSREEEIYQPSGCGSTNDFLSLIPEQSK